MTEPFTQPPQQALVLTCPICGQRRGLYFVGGDEGVWHPDDRCDHEVVPPDDRTVAKELSRWRRRRVPRAPVRVMARPPSG